VREIEAKPFRRDVRALLLNVGSEDFSKRLVEEVRRRMVFHRHLARVAESALEFLLGSGARKLLMLLQLSVEFFRMDDEDRLARKRGVLACSAFRRLHF